ncbi:LexA family protein [Glutamicibacter ardleyensis]|uniref:LexA family protein n=1 Tax=Glutamicibacter ardleyensis TaxID=225894 RepID=UPI003F8E60EA
MIIDRIREYEASASTSRQITEFSGTVPAGFPLPSDGYMATKISLDEILIRDPVSTYIMRVSGDSMTGAGIYSGDEIIIDRGIEPKDGHIVVATLDGQSTVKRLLVTPTGVTLKAENSQHPDITVPELSELSIFGVVTRSLHKLI